jgi:anti-sigma regulatory factor (Ser/Thr protein kinase)
MFTPLRLSLANDLEELERLSLGLEAFCREHGFPPGLTYSLELALDEIVTNIILYGRFKVRRNHIELHVECKKNIIVANVEDDGVPFNPLLAPKPELDLPLDQRQRQVGGLGIHLATSIMDKVAYRRTAGKNILEMEKTIPEECALDK